MILSHGMQVCLEVTFERPWPESCDMPDVSLFTLLCHLGRCAAGVLCQALFQLIALEHVLKTVSFLLKKSPLGGLRQPFSAPQVELNDFCLLSSLRDLLARGVKVRAARFLIVARPP